MLAGHRWYDPAIGRFLTRDPSGAGDNPYAYCGNSPVGNMDPLGLQESGANPGPVPVNVTNSDSSDIGHDIDQLFHNIGYGITSAWHDVFGGGGHSSPSKPTQGTGGSTFIDRLTHGPYGGGFSGVMNNLFDAHTYGLPYAPFLAGTDIFGDYITPATEIAGQFVLASIPGVGEGEAAGLTAEEIAAVSGDWAAGNSKTVEQSIIYHYTEHENGLSLQQYTDAGQQLWEDGQGVKNWGKHRPKWAESYHIQIGNEEGYYTADGKILTYYKKY